MLVHTLFAALGISVVLQSSAIAFSAIKYAGAAYLIYLGVRTLISNEAFSQEAVRRKVSSKALYWQGFISNVFNPKVALFFVAFLPQFIDPNAANPTFQMLLLGLIFTLLGVCWLSCVGYFARRAGHWMGQSRRALGLIRWVSGSVLVGLGVRLALPEKR